MFVTISMLVSLAILGLIYTLSQQKHSAQQRKFELLVCLREVLALCRQHRSLTHQTLSQLGLGQQGMTQQGQIHLQDLQQHLLEKSEQLIQIAHFDNRPSYRILQNSLKKVLNEWSQANVSKNQRLHGKLIRHCMYLMDDVVLAWLAESSREELSDEYHMNWQQIFDAMETLTQLRLCIDDTRNENNGLRIRHYCELMQRKLNQLALISPLTLGSPVCSSAMRQLNEVTDNTHVELESDALYQLSSELSSTIAQVYDHMLNDLVESLYHPLPQLVVA
ncbi:hypothetical protein [Vibrio mimicus]|nr:hypothetical protein [Vibrio mimicus]EEW10772.1 conserved hypothetical protein [Vibrio mimicus VM573]KFE32192.1 hypothetical protein DN31_1299 [Vibrio mimicus]